MNAIEQYPPHPDRAVRISQLEAGKRYFVVNGRWFFTVVSKTVEGMLIKIEGPDGEEELHIPPGSWNDDCMSLEIATTVERSFGGILYDEDPSCDHDIQPVRSGGVKCTKCPGWFCY